MVISCTTVERRRDKMAVSILYGYGSAAACYGHFNRQGSRFFLRCLRRARMKPTACREMGGPIATTQNCYVNAFLLP